MARCSALVSEISCSGKRYLGTNLISNAAAFQPGLCLAKEQETNSTASGSAENRTSSTMEDHTLHDFYLRSWFIAVKEGMGSIVCVMRRVNSTIGCRNDHIQNTVLKGELCFKDCVVPGARAPVNRTRGIPSYNTALPQKTSSRSTLSASSQHSSTSIYHRKSILKSERLGLRSYASPRAVPLSARRLASLPSSQE
ncbi:glycoside hydrolase family 3 protein [Didymella exigua CBS 183.55]|uniref:beta-glucosidase n=1 Tax=Didymella exigua CBS 183.55 TaxID=1150837 RepID=A0A6A5S051_9PLEO|nr:glycoside hydrolase family 3 protein [Didymella exigua CBS 183.55]KAF1933243.1 glycoside hydrolase family 3 protein [Didymella exigua CBS 183.55]